MWRPLFLAWNSLKHHRLRTLILMLCLAITFALPLASRVLIVQFEDQLRSRAEETPLLIGAKGSRFDLVLHSLYFNEPDLPIVKYREFDRVKRTNFGTAIPIHRQLTAQKAPLVGTSSEYFAFRKLQTAQGTLLNKLGDCVLGATVAENLQLQPGDHVTVDVNNVFSIAGIPPLRLNIVGTLKPNHSPDDEAIFVTVKTAWVATGIGHGHAGDPAADHNAKSDQPEKNKVTISASAVLPYTEITPENIGKFHFHGEQLDFPLTTIIVDPKSEREQTLLQGQYVSEEAQYQTVQPIEVVDELMEVVFQFRFFLDLAAILMGITTGCLLILIGWLTLKIRQAEITTMVRLGCSQFMIFQIHAMELGLLLLGAGIITTGILATLNLTGSFILWQFFL